MLAFACVDANAGLLNAQESAELDQINNNSQITSSADDLADKQLQIVKLSNSLTNSNTDLSTATAAFDQAGDNLKRAILSPIQPNNSDQLYAALKSASTVIKNIQDDQNALQHQLEQAQQAQKTAAAKNAELEQKAQQALTKLQEDILTRLAKDSNTPQHLLLKGEYRCKTNDSLQNCIRDPLFKQSAIRNATADDSDTKIDYEIHSFRTTTASIDLNSVLTYNAEATVYIRYSSNLSAQVADILGLKKYSVKLVSDVEANFFIDGNAVGKGKTVNATVSKGKHTITAQYQKESNTTTETIKADKELPYYFSSEKIKQNQQK